MLSLYPKGMTTGDIANYLAEAGLRGFIDAAGAGTGGASTSTDLLHD